MCDQTQVEYKPGEVVWFKISTVWWPALIQDQADLDEEITRGLKKKPFAVVKFFNEDLYEFVKDINQISHYNSNRKFEFIKKGMDTYRSSGDKNKMNKFPEDVVLAEKMTCGNVNILDDPRFAPDEKINYNSLFTPPKKNDKSMKKSKTSLSRFKPSGGNSDSLNRLDNIGTDKGYFTKDLIQNNTEMDAVQFKCDSCDFVCSRLTTLTTHKTYNKNNFCSNKSFIKPSKSSSIMKFEKSPSKRKSIVLDEPLKKKPKVSLKGATPENKKVTKVKSMVKESKEKEKKKSEAMREQLLLDWSEDAEDNSGEAKVDSVGNGLQDSANHKNEPEEKSKELNEPPANKASCFDFEDNDDDDINVSPSIRFGQKLPRIIPKDDKNKSKESKFNDKTANEDELEKEFNNIMKETSVPVVSMMTDSFLLDSSALPDNAVAGKAEENLGTLESSSDLPEAKVTSGALIIKPIEDEDNDSLLRTLESDSAEDEVLKVTSQTNPVKRQLLASNDDTKKKFKIGFAFKDIANESCKAENNNSVLLNKCFTDDGLNTSNEQNSDYESSTSDLRAAESTIEQTLAHFDNASSYQIGSSEKEVPSRKPSRRSSRRLSSSGKSDIVLDKKLSIKNKTADKGSILKTTSNKKMSKPDDATLSGRKCPKSTSLIKPTSNVADIKSSKNDSPNTQAPAERFMDKDHVNSNNLKESVDKEVGKTATSIYTDNSISSSSTFKRLPRKSRDFDKGEFGKALETENRSVQEPPVSASKRRKSLTNKKSNKHLENLVETQHLTDSPQADSLSTNLPTSLAKPMRLSDSEDSKKVLSSSVSSRMPSSLSSRIKSPLVRYPTKASLKEGISLSAGYKPVDKNFKISQEDSKSSYEQVTKELSGNQIKQKDSSSKRESAVDTKLLQKSGTKPLKVTSKRETSVQHLTLPKSTSKEKMTSIEDSSLGLSSSKHVKPYVNKELFSQDKLLSPNKLKSKSSSKKKLSPSDGATVDVLKETDDNSPSKMTSAQRGSPLKFSVGLEKSSKKKIFDSSDPRSLSHTPIDKSEKPNDKSDNQSYVKSDSELKSTEKSTQQPSEKIPTGLKSMETSSQPSSPVKSPNFKADKISLKSKRSSYSTSPEKASQKPLVKPMRSPNKSPFDFCVIEKTQPFSSLFLSENAFDKLTKEPACDVISHKRTSTDTSTTKKSDGCQEKKKSSKTVASPKKSSNNLEGSKRVLECSKSPSGSMSPKKPTPDQDSVHSSDKSLKVESDLEKTSSLAKLPKKSSGDHHLSQNKSSKEKNSDEIKYSEKNKLSLPKNLTPTKEETCSRRQHRKSSSRSSKHERSRSRSKKNDNRGEKKSSVSTKNRNDSRSMVLKQPETCWKERDSFSHRKSESKKSGSHKSRRESSSRSSSKKHNDKRSKIKDSIKEGKEQSSVETDGFPLENITSTSIAEVSTTSSTIGRLDDSVHHLITSVVSNQPLTSTIADNDFSNSPKTIYSEDNVAKEMEEIFNRTVSSDQTTTTKEPYLDTNDLNKISQTKPANDNVDCGKQLEVKSEERECFTNDTKVLVSKTHDQKMGECSSIKLNNLPSSRKPEVSVSTPLSTYEASSLDKSDITISHSKKDSTIDKIIPSSTHGTSNDKENPNTKSSPSTLCTPDKSDISTMISSSTQKTTDDNHTVITMSSSTRDSPNNVGVIVPPSIREISNNIGTIPASTEKTNNEVGKMISPAVQETPNDIDVIIHSPSLETVDDISKITSIQESPNDGELEVCAMSSSVSKDDLSKNKSEIQSSIPLLTLGDCKAEVNSISPVMVERNDESKDNLRTSSSAEKNLNTDNKNVHKALGKTLEDEVLSVPPVIHESCDEVITTENMVASTHFLEANGDDTLEKNINSTGVIEKGYLSINDSEINESTTVNIHENVSCEENSQVKPVGVPNVKLDAEETPVINDSLTHQEDRVKNDIVEAQGIVQSDESSGKIPSVKSADEIPKINSSIYSFEHQINSEEAVLSIVSGNALELGPAKPESKKLPVSQDSSLKSESGLLQPDCDQGVTRKNEDGSLAAKFDLDQTGDASEALLSQTSINNDEPNREVRPPPTSDISLDVLTNDAQPSSSADETDKSENLSSENILQENVLECSSLPQNHIIPRNNVTIPVGNKTLDLPSNIQTEPSDIVKSTLFTDQDMKVNLSRYETESDLDSKLDIASEVVICTDQDQQELIEKPALLNQSLPKIPSLIESNLSKSIKKAPVVFRCKASEFKLNLSNSIVPTEHFSPKILGADFLTPDKIKEIFKKGEVSSSLTSLNVSPPLIRPIVVPPQALLDDKSHSKSVIDSSCSEPSFSSSSSIVADNNYSQQFVSSDVLDINSMPIVIADAPDMESKAIPVTTSVPIAIQQVVSTSSSSQSTDSREITPSSSAVPQPSTSQPVKVKCCFLKLVKPGTVQPGEGYKIYRIPPKPSIEPRSRFISHNLPFVQSMNSRIIQRKNSLGNKLSDFCFKKQIVIVPNSTSRRVIIKSDSKNKSRIFNHILRSAPQNIQPKDLLVTIPHSEAGTSGKSRTTLSSKNIQIMSKRYIIANKNKNLAGSVNLKSLQSVGLISNKKLVGICKAPDAPESSPKKVVRFLEPELVKPAHVINTKKRPNIIKPPADSSSCYKLEITGDQSLSRSLNEVERGKDSDSVGGTSVQPEIESTSEDHSLTSPASKRIPESKGHTDILAKALADTQVFQSDLDTSSGEQPYIEGIGSYVTNSTVSVGGPIMPTGGSTYNLDTLSVFASEVCSMSVQNTNDALGPSVQFNSTQLSSSTGSASVTAYSVGSDSSLSKTNSEQKSVESESTTKLTADINLSEIELPPGHPPENSHLTDISSIPLPPEPYTPSDSQSDPPDQFTSSQYHPNPSDDTFQSPNELCLPSLYQGVSNR